MRYKKSNHIHLRISFVTNDFLNVKEIVTLIEGLETQTKAILDRDSELGIIGIKPGSIVLDLVVITASVAAVGSFVLQIVAVCQQQKRPRSKLAKSVSRIMHFKNVTKIVFESEGKRIELSKSQVPRIESMNAQDLNKGGNRQITKKINRRQTKLPEMVNEEGVIARDGNRFIFTSDEEAETIVEVDPEWYRDRRVDHLVDAPVYVHGRIVTQDNRSFLIPFDVAESAKWI